MMKYGRILERTINDPNKIIIEDNIATMYLYNADCEEIATTIFDAQLLISYRDINGPYITADM